MVGSEGAEATKAAQTELSRFRSAMRAAGVGTWSLDLGTQRMIWSEVCAEIHGEPPGAAPSFSEALAYWAPEFRVDVAKALGECAQHGEPFVLTPRLVTQAGIERWVRLTGQPALSDSDEIVAIDGTIQERTEEVLAIQAAEATASGLRRTLESIGEAIFVLDLSWTFTLVNGAASQVLGGGAEEFIGRVFWEVFSEHKESALGERFRMALETGQSCAFVHLDEARGKWLDIKAYASAEGLAVSMTDITHELARDQHLHLLEVAVARQSDILIVTDAESINGPKGPRIIYVNDAFTRQTGYSREEVIGRTPRILQGPGTQRAELDRIRAALRSWQPIRSELINYTKDGREIWLEIDIVPIADSNGWYTHWVSVQRDVTARKLAEAEFRLQEERFRLVTKATHDVIWDWDAGTGALWFNEEFAIQFGPDPEGTDLDVDPWERRLHPEDRNRILARMREVIEGEGLRWLEEYRFLRWDSSVVHVVDRGFVLRDDQGQVLRMIGSMVDVTERRKLDERLRQSQRLEAIGQLTGGVAHDFNNLLTVILGNAELLAEHFGSNSLLAETAEVIVSAAERGAELTYRLLAIARRQPLEPKSVDLELLIRNMEGLLSRTLSESIEIRHVCALDLWNALVDPGQLEVALLNLAINARDAMPSGGNLIFDLTNAPAAEDVIEPGREHGAMVRIAVTDTGEGMTPAIAERAFDPFFTTKEVGKGTGLGLSMVYGFARQSGGFATIQSSPGEGTTVALYLPRAFALADVPLVAVGDPVWDVGTESILVVEDDELVRQHICSLLRKLGYRVTDTGTGPDALSILKQNPDFDLVFTDIVLPGGMNGRQIAEAALRLRPGIKILFTSGYVEDGEVLETGLDPEMALLRKPYRQQDLALKLRALFGRKPGLNAKNMRSVGDPNRMKI